jgi:hypothetical protein
MESQPPPAALEPAAPVTKKLPRWALVLILTLGGLALAIGGCGFFLANMTSTRTENQALIGGAGFVVGVLMLLIGGLTALVTGAQRLFKKRDGN